VRISHKNALFLHKILKNWEGAVLLSQTPSACPSDPLIPIFWIRHCAWLCGLSHNGVVTGHARDNVLLCCVRVGSSPASDQRRTSTDQWRHATEWCHWSLLVLQPSRQARCQGNNDYAIICSIISLTEFFLFSFVDDWPI